MIDRELVFSRIRLVGSGSQVKPPGMTSGVTGCVYGFLCIFVYVFVEMWLGRGVEASAVGYLVRRIPVSFKCLLPHRKCLIKLASSVLHL